MSITMLRALALLVLASARAVAADQPPPADPPPTEETHVKGTPPIGEGRWLVLTDIVNGGRLIRVNASVWEIGRAADGSLTMHDRLILLPKAQFDALEAANAQSTAWEPTQADLDAILRAWDGLEPEPRGVAQVTNELIGRDAYDADLQKEPVTKDARGVVRQIYVYAPGESRPINQVNLLAIDGQKGDVLTGKHVTVTVAAAPFPIPIKLEGTVRLIPLARPASSPWTRIADVFRGCN